MYFVDCCVVVGRSVKGDAPYLSLEKIEELYRRHGIAQGMACHVNAAEYDPDGGNRLLLSLIEGRRMFRPLLAVSLNTDPAADPVLDQIQRVRSRAVIAFPKDHGYEFEDWVVGRWLQELRKRRIALFVNVNQVGLTPLVRTMRQYPEIVVVLLGTRYHDYAMQHNAMGALPNLWLDMSQNHLFDGLRRWADAYGSKRLVFGSGLPRYSPGSPKYQLLRSGLDAGDLAAVAHGNLESLLGLEKSSDLPGAAAPLPCPLVDSHCHGGPWPRYSMQDEPKEWVVQVCEREGVGMAAVNTIFYGDRALGNDRTAALCALRPGRWFGVAGVTAHDEPAVSLKELERCERMGFRGIKIYPPHDQIPASDPKYAPILEFVDARGWSVLYHGMPDGVAEVAARYPRANFILGHSVATPAAMDLARTRPNVHVEVCASTRSREDWRKGCNEVLAGKILFGSDFTLISPAAMAGAIMDVTDDPERQRMILRDNGARLLRVPPPV